MNIFSKCLPRYYSGAHSQEDPTSHSRLSQTPQATRQRCVCLLTSNQVIGFEHFPAPSHLPLLSSPPPTPSHEAFKAVPEETHSQISQEKKNALLSVSMQRVDEEPPHNSTHLSRDTVQMLIQKSVEAKKNAYCVYSKFPVGAALLTADGCVYTGNWRVKHGHTWSCFQGLCSLYLR